MRNRQRPLVPRARRLSRAIVSATLTRDQIEAETPGLHHSLTGEFVFHRGVSSSVLGHARDVLVYLPPDYHEDPGRRYPVLYFNDGQNLFDGATSFIRGQEWQLDETAERLIREGAMAPLIMVGIYHGADRRLDEFTPSRDPRRRAGGSADLYGRMLVDELMPFIDLTYRTLSGPANTGLGGSSMGGLVTLYLGMRHPDIFGRLAVMSPSVWWANREVVQVVRDLDRRPMTRIWLDIGTAEGRIAVTDVRLLRDVLTERGWREGVDLAYREEPGAHHTEGAWAARVEPMLRFLYG